MQVEPLALQVRPVVAREQPAEEAEHDHEQHHRVHARDGVGGGRDDAGRHEAAERAEQHEHAHEPLHQHRHGRRLLAHRLRREVTHTLELLAEEQVNDHTDRHADASRGKPEVPAVLDLERAADERGRKGPHVDPHVEDREAGVAPGVVRRVELPHHDRDVRLQEARAQHDEAESDKEERRARNGHREVAGGDDDAAHEHAPPLSQEPVRDPPAGEVHEVDERRVEPVDERRGRHVVAEAAVHGGGGHEQDEQRPHPVVREPLEELGKEQVREAERVAEESRVAGADGGRGRRAF